jgi:hypothetical protein
MIRRIPKNKRRAFPYINFPILIFIRKSKSFSIIRNFNFSNSAIYQFSDADQLDVNKLYGFSIGFHHVNSFRFGWRPNKDLTKIEIVGYEYHNKIRIPTISICEVELNKWYKYEITYIPSTNEIQYVVMDSENIITKRSSIELKHKLSWGYKLYLYFGGNKKAPHDIIIYSES